MKKINWFKKIFVNTITSPINLLALVWSWVLIIHIRAAIKAQKQHVWIENHENAKRKK